MLFLCTCVHMHMCSVCLCVVCLNVHASVHVGSSVWCTSEIHSQADHFKGKTFSQGTGRCPKASRLQDRSVNTSKLNPQAEPLPIRTHTQTRGHAQQMACSHPFSASGL